ncbi:MAG TPA: flagellin [Candidatus Didemnitutus sp.]|jgi:flagellar hook-associated protein 3 FlgL
MRVANTTISDNIVRQIQQLSSQQTQLQSEVSSGLRITQPSDDSAAFGRVMGLESSNRALSQYASNANTALGISQATVSALEQIKSISDRATQIGVLGTGTEGAQAMAAYGSEVDQLIQQAVQLGNSQLNNNYLFSGTAITTSPYTTTTDAQGQITAVSYAGNTSQAAIPMSQNSSLAPGSDGATNQGLSDFINHLISLRDALNAGDTNAVGTAQNGLLDTENTIVNAISGQGAVQMRIEVNQAQQTSAQTSIGQLISDDTDADLPSTVVKLTQAQNSYQAALQSAASLMKTSLLNYLPVT